MALWGVELKEGEPYALQPSGGRLRLTQATLGNFDHSGWGLLECKVDDQELVKVGAINPQTAPVCPLDLEFEEGENVVLSVIGQNSVHLSGYYIQSYNCQHGQHSEQTVLPIPMNDDNGAAVENVVEKKGIDAEHLENVQDGMHQGAAVENVVEKKGIDAEHPENVQDGMHHKYIDVLDNGMTIEDLVEGNVDARIASNGNKVQVRYVTKLSNGDIVTPTGQKETCKFKLGVGEVIRGLDLGVSGMRVGGKRRLSIPPSLGYGGVGKGNIPPNSHLIYDIELLRVKRARISRKEKRAKKVASQASVNSC